MREATPGKWSGRQSAQPSETGAAERLVTLGRIAGPYGVLGWVKVHSETDPRQNIVGYSPWWLRHDGEWECWEVETGRPHGKTVVAKLKGCDDRDAAAALLGAEIAVQRGQLPDDLAPGQYYWTDLEGLLVVNEDGAVLGRVDHLFETGANDVMVVRGERERLIPYLVDRVIKRVDLKTGEIRVDWEPDF